MMISYAQNREDVLLRRAFPELKDGFYIDVGANEPVQDSVTKYFSEIGWRGINIEPHAVLHKKLQADRPNDVNLNVGVSDREATLEFQECVSNSGLSTFSSEMAEYWKKEGSTFVTRTVPVRTLADICEAHVRGTIDFLKIDAEAHEREVIAGNDWTRWRPRIVLIEATYPETWKPLLHAANYLPAAFDGINLYYVRAEESELLDAFKSPVCCLDEFIPFWVHHSINSLTERAKYFEHHYNQLLAQQKQHQDLGPNAMKVAHKVHDLSAKHPKVAQIVRRAVGWKPAAY